MKDEGKKRAMKNYDEKFIVISIFDYLVAKEQGEWYQEGLEKIKNITGYELNWGDIFPQENMVVSADFLNLMYAKGWEFINVYHDIKNQKYFLIFKKI